MVFDNLINQSQKDYKKLSNNIKSKQLVLGQMPDWNPAEMIGYQPNNLAYSLYHELITKESWSIARKKMGYKKMYI